MKMKRFAAALLALILCAAFMTACSPKPEQPAATSGNASSGNASSGSAAAEPAATAEPTSAPTPVPPETTAMPEKTDTSVTVTPEKNGLYDALCDLFNNYHEGTAGCSLTGARIAATIMDFSLTNGMDAVRSGAAAFDLGEETEVGEKLTDQLTAMYEPAMGLDGESGKNLLADGGNTPAHNPYSAKDVRDTYTAIFAERGCEAPAVVRIYRSDANAEHFLAFGAALDGTEITAETLNGAMDGLIFENGAAFNTVTADKVGHIIADLNDAFAAQVRPLGTSGE